MVDPNGQTWTDTYDNEDRLLTASAPAPQSGGSALTTQYQYDPVGNRTVAIDANGQVTKDGYDARNSLVEVDQSPNAWTDPNATPSPKYVTAYAYDHLGNLTRLTRDQGDSANERATDYLYDGAGHLRQEIEYPSWPATTPTLTRTYVYDGDGNQVSLVDPLNQTTSFAYDALNRPTGVSYSDGQTPNVAYAYDADSNRTSMTDGAGTTTYVSDELGRLTGVTSPGNVTVGSRYDLDGNRTKVIYLDGTAVVSTYDKTSRLASLADWASRTTSYGYFPDGHLQTVTNVDGTTATYSQDNAQRLTQVLNQQGSTTISQHAYTLDSVGNRTQRQETLAQVGGQPATTTTTYGYDTLYRLTGDGTNSYAYDPVGNRTTLTVSGTPTAYAYDRADRITTAGTTAYTVNADGNVTARGADAFAYDQANRLKSATVAGTTTTYVYDGDGNRASETVGGATTSYAYDRAGDCRWCSLTARASTSTATASPTAWTQLIPCRSTTRTGWAACGRSGKPLKAPLPWRAPARCRLTVWSPTGCRSLVTARGCWQRGRGKGP
jgi:YD repeat-containing protein